MMQAEARALPMSDVNTTPLIDVMLVLLIIFMIAAPMMTHSLRVPSPAPSNEVYRPPARHLIQLDELGATVRLTLDGQLISRSSLRERLAIAARLPAAEQAEFQIDAAPGVRFDQVVALLAEAQHTGAAHVGLARSPD